MNKSKILLVGASGKQGNEYFEPLQNDFFFTGVVDSNFQAQKSKGVAHEISKI